MATDFAISWTKPYSLNILKHDFFNGAKTEFNVCIVRNGLSFLGDVNSLYVWLFYFVEM